MYSWWEEELIYEDVVGGGAKEVSRKNIKLVSKIVVVVLLYITLQYVWLRYSKFQNNNYLKSISQVFRGVEAYVVFTYLEY